MFESLFPFEEFHVCNELKIMISVYVSLNIVALIAYISLWIKFLRKPPLLKFNVHKLSEYIDEFSFFRRDLINAIKFCDIMIVALFLFYILARIVYLILF